DRLELLDAQQIDGSREQEGAGPQGNRGKVDGDPQAPRHKVGEVGDDQTAREDKEGADESSRQHEAEKAQPGGKEQVFAHVAYHEQFTSSFSWRLRRGR